LDVLVTLVQAYEARHHPMNLPDPIEAIRFRMEQQGLTIKDLEPMIGRSNRVYEVLNGERRLTLNMIRRLRKGFGIPAEVLIGRDEGFGLAACRVAPSARLVLPRNNCRRGCFRFFSRLDGWLGKTIGV
jgi:plasmid maintenance system antidote protein VapI